MSSEASSNGVCVCRIFWEFCFSSTYLLGVCFLRLYFLNEPIQISITKSKKDEKKAETIFTESLYTSMTYTVYNTEEWCGSKQNERCGENASQFTIEQEVAIVPSTKGNETQRGKVYGQTPGSAVLPR